MKKGQPEMKEPQVIQNGLGQLIWHKEEPEKKESWAKLRILNFILNPKRNHEKIMSKKAQDKALIILKKKKKSSDSKKN